MIISDGKKIKVYNGTASTISSNKVVIVKGKTAHLASYTDNDCKIYPLGYTLNTIPPGQFGEVILEGSILNINTTAYGTGNAILYLSTSGNLTVTKPSVPIIIATISKNDPIAGEIYFKVFTPSVATWGDIIGNLTNQTDLQTSLNGKFNNPTGNNTQYIKGDGTLGTLPNSSGIPHGNTSGTNTYTTTISGVTAYNDADAFLIRFVNGNTTSATLNINSLGAIPLYRNNDGTLIGGDIVDGAEMLCIYNSTTNRFQVIGTTPNILLSYVTNAESTTITRGQAVYAFGGTGDRLTVKLANNSGDATSAQTIGVVLTTSIGANQKGLIIMQGQIDGLNLFPTSTWADGDAVYLGATPGSFSKTKPLAPNHLVYLGFVTTASNGSAGRMYVRVQNGYELGELHDVALSSPTNGQVLTYNLTSDLWVNQSLPTSTSKSVLFGNFGAGSVGAGAILYAGFVKATALYSAAQAFQARTVVPIACVAKNFTVQIGDQPATGSAVFTIRVDTVDSAYTLTIAAGSLTGSYQNTSSTLSLTAGATIDVKVRNNAAASTGAIVCLAIILEI